MKLKTWYLALVLVLCMLTFCSCSTSQSNATEMEQAITSFLEEAQSKENAEQLPSVSEDFISYGTYRCANNYYSASSFKSYPGNIPSITLHEDGICQLSVNYMEGVDVIDGVYIVEGKKITVTLTDYSNSIFYEGDDCLENTFVFTIIDDSNLVIEKGYYAVNDGDCFTKEIPILDKKGGYTTADCELLLENSIENLAFMYGVNLAYEPSGGMLLEGKTLTTPIIYLNGKIVLLTPYTIQPKEAPTGIILFGEAKETTPIDGLHFWMELSEIDSKDYTICDSTIKVSESGLEEKAKVVLVPTDKADYRCVFRQDGDKFLLNYVEARLATDKELLDDSAANQLTQAGQDIF